MVTKLQALGLIIGLSTRDGYCYACGRHANWILKDGYYCCTRCGRDPVEQKPE